MTIITKKNLFFLGGSTEAGSSFYQKQHFSQTKASIKVNIKNLYIVAPNLYQRH